MTAPGFCGAGASRTERRPDSSTRTAPHGCQGSRHPFESFHHFIRTVRAATSALASLAFLAPAPASAEVLASNIGQPDIPLDDGVSHTFVFNTDSPVWGFTAGSNAAGYGLESIEVEHRTPEDFPNTGKEYAK